MIWPFRRRKPKAQRPPLNEDWRPGDRACCIDGDWGRVKGPAKGSIHRVEFVYPGQCNTSGLPGWGLKLAAPAAVDAIAQAESEAAMSPLNDLPEPTDAQKEAGNYKKGHANIGGLNVSIENPAGTSRRPEWPPLKHSYGYVKRSEGADGDHVDVFLGPKAADPANPVFIVDQVNKDGSFDEHKVMVGFADKGAARRGYLANYEKGWTGLGDLTEMPFEQFKDWVKDSANTLKPAGARVAAPAPTADATAAAPQAEPEAKRFAYHDYADPAENALGRTVVDAMNDMANRQAAIAAIGDAVERGDVSPGFASVQLQRLGANRVEADAIIKRAPVDPSEETAVERQRRERAERRAAKDAAKADTAFPAPAAPLDAQDEKFRQIDAGFAENRKVMRNFKRGDEVEWDHNNFYRDGRGRTFTGIVDKIQSTDQGYLTVKGDGGTTSSVAARVLRHKTSAPVGEAAAPSQPASTRVIRREPDKKNPNPYVRKGERYSVSEDVDYLSAGAVYEVESAEKRNAHFVNVESGGRTSLPNYRMQMALTKGVMEKVNPEAAQTAAEQSPAPTRSVAPAASKPAPFANNKLVTASQVEAARARIREKMNRINSGIDPELLTDGMVIAAAYIESGVRSFAAYAKAMRDDFGTRITPYLLSFWEGARHYPGLDTEGMTSPDASRAEHAALVGEGLPVEEAIALGTEVAKPKAAKVVKTAAPAGARVLRDDWGVDHIDGWKPIEGGKNQETDYGLKGGLKDAFLADATAYLRAVASALRPLGFEPHINAKGKEENAVSRNASGVATSGDVSLHLRTADGASIFATVGGTSLRGVVPTSKSGVAVMYRVSLKEGDKQATSGVNRWAPVDLTAIELADTIAWEASRQKPELTRDHVQPSRQSDEPGRRDAESVGRGGVSPDEGERGHDPQSRPQHVDSGALAAGQPDDVGAAGAAGRDEQDGVRGAGTDVADERRSAESGLSGDGRTGSGGAGDADASAGGTGGGQQRPAGSVAGRSAAPATEVAGRNGADQRTGRGRGRNDGQLTEPDLFADVSKKVEAVDPATVAPALPKTPSPARSGPGNFHIANPLEIVGGGPVARFDRNRQAIETYNMLRDEGRAATADEQRTLAGYTGWGSFGQELFQGTWQRPMPKEAWQERDRWLRDHLGREEWESAQRSITNAHYTDPPTVMAMWAMMQRMGFTGGRVLEPSMGIGNFFGMMPAAVADRSQLAGIELDRLTGGMAQLLYPDANIRIMPYQDSKTPDGFYDAVIGNWPFENTVIADRRYDRLSPFLHDYFFLKAVDQVRAGGIVMGITSSGSMDKKATGIRRELAKKAELVAAFRLPSGAFADYAGTKVVTDIVILRKRAEPISLADNEGWINSVPYQTPNGDPRILIREKLRKQLDAVQRRERLHGQGVANALFQSRQLTKRADEWEAKVAAFDKAGTPEAVAKIVADNAGKGFTVTIDGKEFDKRKDADEAIQSFGAHNLRVGDEPRVFGTFGGHNLKIGWPAYEERPQLSMVIDGRGFDGGSMQGLEQSLRKFGPEIERMRRDVVESRASVERMQAMAAEPFHMSGELERYEAALAALELDIKANPVPPPAWLRAGAPVDTEVFWDGKPFNVTGHRWTADGWFVLADDAKGSAAIPYAEAKDAQGINVYEERPFEAPEVIEAKAGKDDASVVATPDSPAAHSIGGLHGGGFQSVEALEEHLEGTALGGSIAPLVRAGDIVLHASSDTLPTGGGLFSGQNQSDLRAWSRTIDAIVRGDPVNRAMIRLSRTPIVLQQLGMPDGELVMSRGKIAKARREHPSVPLAIWKDLPRLIADPRAVFPSRRGDGSMVLVIEGRDADNNPIFVPVVASQDGSSVVLSVYGKTDGDSVIATDLRRAIADKEPHYIRNGLADAFASPEGQAGVSPSHAPVASEVPTKPARRILSARDVVKKSAAIEGNVQGMTTPDGRVHLVADNLTSRTALPVLLHEMFHAGVRPLVGEQTWTAMLNRLEVMYRAAAQRAASGERANSDFWAKALDRVDMAAPSQALEVEEFAAYAVEQQAQAPAGVQQAISRLIGAFKAWMVRRFGKQIGSITPSQLEALAKAALRAGTMAPREGTALSRVVPPAEQIDAATPGLIHNLVTKAMDGQFSVLGAAPLRPLIAELGAKIPAAQEYLALKLGMDTTRDQWHAKADEVAQPWLKFRMLHSADNTKLMDLMHESTLAGVDPSQEFKSALTNLDRQIIAEGPGTEAYDAAYAKAQNDTTRKSEHARLVPLFNALPAEGKRLFGQVRDTYRSLSAAFEQALLENLSKALDIKLTQAQRAFDVEAMRVLNSGMTKEAADKAISAAERELLKAKQLQGWAKGARMTRLRHFFETNNLSGPYFPLARFGNFFVTVRDADDQVISFSRFEKPGDQQAFAREMKEAGHDVQIGVLEDGGALKAQVDARFVADVEDILEGADVSDTVRDAVWQRWLESMPDMSIRTSRIHRKGRAGFSTDALRAFGHHMFHGSHQLARLKYALDMEEAIALARDQAKTMPDPVRAGLLVNEMARRHQFIMNPTGGPLAQTVTSAAFVWFLAASPAAALVNTSQTAVLGVPILAAYDGRARVGSARAAKELTRALRDFASGKGHAADAKRLTDDERKAMDAAYETGVIERTQSHDLAGVGETGVAYSPVRTKVMAAISWAFHHTERLNREVTFLAAYRMARAKNEPHQMAIDRAAELTWKIHFDYQNTSRPRAMQGDTAKMLFVFRNFNVNMLWRLFRDVHQAVKGDKAARKEALIQLAGTTGMMMLSAGIRGTWMYGIAMMLASLFLGDDAEDDFQKAIVATLGRRLGGMAINGVPGHVLGIDLSNRIGMPDLWFRSPDRELEGQQEFDYWALQVMGAGVGTLRNMWTGVSMMADGNVERGVETMMPKFAKDVMRASRYMTEGARTLKGDPIMEDMPPADAIRQVLGFTPAALSERYDRNRSMKNREQRILDERGLILSDYDLAQRAGENTTAIMDRLEAFNEANPDYPITGKSIRQSMRSRDRMRANKIGGVYLNQKLAARLNEEAPTLLYDGEEKEE